jgi:hypothetical protein
MPKGTPRRSAPRKGAVIELDELTQDFKIHKNLTQDVIMTTQDKLRLTLIEHREVLNSRREWVSAATLALSLVTTLTLTSFQDRLGLSADMWRALYGLSFIMALFWLGSALVRLFRNRHKSDINYLIKQIKEVGRMENSDGLD